VNFSHGARTPVTERDIAFLQLVVKGLKFTLQKIFPYRGSLHCTLLDEVLQCVFLYWCKVTLQSGGTGTNVVAVNGFESDKSTDSREIVVVKPVNSVKVLAFF
jgi:hypothetical protein